MPEQCHRLNGELDFRNADDLRYQLMSMVAANQDDLVVDCDGLRFIDTTGVSVFTGVSGILARAHRRFRLVNVHGNPRRKIEVLGLTKLLGLENAR